MNSNNLRFAALCRVSTEQQQKVGESLNTQKLQIEQVVNLLEGRIVGWYGGQEHATPGHEKREVSRLIEDSKKGRFDAVIVTDADRWSRDNSASRNGLEVFKNHGIRFFTGSKEWDLFQPMDKMFLGMSAVMGEFFANNQMRKSMQNRITRAKRGVPTGGRLPFGRKFIRDENRQGGRWVIDNEKHAMVKDAAKRYLAGESITDIAKEYGVNYANLWKVLTKVSGKTWEIKFQSKELKIYETVTFEIPALLPDETIQAILAKAKANRTYTHGHIKHQYLFARMISCAHCGYAMFGQTNHNGLRYYRHAHTDRDKECPGAKTKAWVSADEVERLVLRHLFETFGNPTAVRKAIEAATPNHAQVLEQQRQLVQLDKDLAKIESARQRLLDLFVDGKIEKQVSDRKFDDLNEREKRLKERKQRLEDELAHVPSAESIKAFSIEVGGIMHRYADNRLARKIADIKTSLKKMSYNERRQLCQSVFAGKTADGRRMGIWITWNDTGKDWNYRIEGRLISKTGAGTDESYVFEPELLCEDGVTKSTQHSRDTTLPAHRSCRRVFRWWS
jgi:site-specific DNA recombinase